MFLGLTNGMPFKNARTHEHEEHFVFMFIRITLEGNPKNHWFLNSTWVGFTSEFPVRFLLGVGALS